METLISKIFTDKRFSSLDNIEITFSKSSIQISDNISKIRNKYSYNNNTNLLLVTIKNGVSKVYGLFLMTPDNTQDIIITSIKVPNASLDGLLSKLMIILDKGVRHISINSLRNSFDDEKFALIIGHSIYEYYTGYLSSDLLIRKYETIEKKDARSINKGDYTMTLKSMYILLKNTKIDINHINYADYDDMGNLIASPIKSKEKINQNDDNNYDTKTSKYGETNNYQSNYLQNSYDDKYIDKFNGNIIDENDENIINNDASNLNIYKSDNKYISNESMKLKIDIPKNNNIIKTSKNDTSTFNCSVCNQLKSDRLTCNKCSNITCESCFALSLIENISVLTDNSDLVRGSNGLCIPEYVCVSCKNTYDPNVFPFGIKSIFDKYKQELETKHGTGPSYEELVYTGKKQPNNILLTRLGIVDTNAPIYSFAVNYTRQLSKTNNYGVGFADSARYYKYIAVKGTNYIVINSNNGALVDKKYIIILNNNGKVDISKYIYDIKDHFKTKYIVVCHIDIWENGKSIIEKKLLVDLYKHMVPLIITSDRNINDLIDKANDDIEMRYNLPIIDRLTIRFSDIVYNDHINKYKDIKTKLLTNNNSFNSYEIIKDKDYYTSSVLIGDMEGIFEFFRLSRDDIILINKIFINADLWNSLDISIRKQLIKHCCLYNIYIIFGNYSESIINDLYIDKLSVDHIPTIITK